MADFNVNAGEVNPNATPAQPVQGNTSFAEGLSGASRLVGATAPAFMETARQNYKLQIKDTASLKVAQFEQQQLKVAQAHEQGSITQAEANLRMRQNYYQAIGNNPTIVDQLTDAHKAIIGTDALGKNVAEGTPEEQLEKKLKGEAASAGWIKPGMSDADSDLALSKYQQMKQGEQLLSQQQAQLTLERGRIGLVSDKLGIQQQKQSLATGAITQQTARLNLQEKTTQIASQNALGQIQDGYGYKFATDLNAIRDQFEKGPKDATSRVQYQQQVDNLMANVTQQVSGLGRNAGAGYIDNILTPMKMRVESLKGYISGDVDAKALENVNNNALATQKALITGDPDVARTVAISGLVRNVSGSIADGIDRTVINLIRKNGKVGSGITAAGGLGEDDQPTAHLTTTDPVEAKSVDSYLATMKVALAKHPSGDINDKDGSLGELQTNMSSVLKSVSDYSSATKNPKQYNKVVDFLASPEYGQFASSDAGKLTSDDAKNAKLVLQQDYENVVLPLLRSEYTKSVTGSQPISGGPFAGTEMRNGELRRAEGAKADTVQQTVNPVFSGSGITFRANDPGDKDAVSKAKDLNKSVAPVINKLVRMSAHLEGSVNYKKVYTDNYADIFAPADKADEDKIGLPKVDLSNDN